MSEVLNASRTPATGHVLLRILRLAAYEARDRNATVEGKPASITYYIDAREEVA